MKDWIKPTELETEQVAKNALAAACEQLKDIDKCDHPETTKKILLAYRAVYLVIKEANAEFKKANESDTINVHGYFIDERHVVASAVFAASNYEDPVDVHPYAKVAEPFCAFAAACIALKSFRILNQASMILNNLENGLLMKF